MLRRIFALCLLVSLAAAASLACAAGRVAGGVQPGARGGDSSVTLRLRAPISSCAGGMGPPP